MTTPTSSMARMAHSPPSPPPSAARLGQDSSVSIFPPTLAVSVVGVVISVWGVVSGFISSSVVSISWSEPMEDEDGLIYCNSAGLHVGYDWSPGSRIVGHVELSMPAASKVSIQND